MNLGDLARPGYYRYGGQEPVNWSQDLILLIVLDLVAETGVRWETGTMVA